VETIKSDQLVAIADIDSPFMHRRERLRCHQTPRYGFLSKHRSSRRLRTCTSSHQVARSSTWYDKLILLVDSYFFKRVDMFFFHGFKLVIMCHVPSPWTRPTTCNLKH
jgi:hypothetical protein